MCDWRASGGLLLVLLAQAILTTRAVKCPSTSGPTVPSRCLAIDPTSGTAEYLTTSFTIPAPTLTTIPAVPGGNTEVRSSGMVVDGEYIIVVGETSGAALNSSIPGGAVSTDSPDGFMVVLNMTTMATLYTVQMDSHSGGADVFQAAITMGSRGVGRLPNTHDNVSLNELVFVVGTVGGDLDGSGHGVHHGKSDAAVTAWRKETGELMWVRQLGTAEADSATAVTIDGEGGVIWATGSTFGSLYAANPKETESLWVACLAYRSGEVLHSWQRGGDFDDNVAPNAVAFVPTGGYLVVVGVAQGPVFGLGTEASKGSGNGFIVSFETTAGRMGNVASVVVPDLPLHDEVNDIILTPNHKVVITGTFQNRIKATFFGRRLTFEPQFMAQLLVRPGEGKEEISIVRGYPGEGLTNGVSSAVVTESAAESGVHAGYILGQTYNNLEPDAASGFQRMRRYASSALMRLDYTSIKTSWIVQTPPAVKTAGALTPRGLAYSAHALFEVGFSLQGLGQRLSTYIRRYGLCPPGSKLTYSEVEREGIHCTKCPSGSYQSFADELECLPCPAGTYSLEGYSACVPCPPGKFQSATGQSSCDECPTSKFNSGCGASACTDCGPGTFGNVTGLTQCYVCPVGTAHGASGVSDITGCQACNLGSYNPCEGSSACRPAEPGSYVATTGASNTTLCPVGTANINSGQNLPSACAPAVPGNFSAEVGMSMSRHCPPGSAQPLAGQAGCVACDVGEEAPAWGSTRCRACGHGFVTFDNGTSACVPCPLGHFANATTPEGKVSCSVCPANTYADKPGTGPACIPCPLNSHSPPGSKRKKDCRCNKHFYGDNGQGYGCRKCPAGARCLDKSIDPEAAPGFYIESTANIIERRNITFHKGERKTLPSKLFGVQVTLSVPLPNDAVARRSMEAVDSVLDFDQTTYACTPSSSCPGGVESCVTGYTGLSCMSCHEGYYRSAAGHCLSCVDTWPLWTNVLIVASMAVVLITTMVFCVGCLCINDTRALVTTKVVIPARSANQGPVEHQKLPSSPAASAIGEEVDMASMMDSRSDDDDPIPSLHSPNLSKPAKARSPSRDHLLGFSSRGLRSPMKMIGVAGELSGRSLSDRQFALALGPSPDSRSHDNASSTAKGDIEGDASEAWSRRSAESDLEAATSSPAVMNNEAQLVSQRSEKPFVKELEEDTSYTLELRSIAAMNSNRLFSSTARLVRLVQVSSVLFQLKVDWPSSIGILQSTFSALQLNSDLFSGFQCAAGGMSYMDKVIVRMVIPGVVFLILGGATLVLRLIASLVRLIQYGFQHKEVNSEANDTAGARGVGLLESEGIIYGLDSLSNHLERVFWVTVSVLYLFVHVSVMEHFGCHERASGRYFMTTMSDVECYTMGGEWADALPVVILCFLLYTIGIPAALAAVLFAAQRKRTMVYIVQRYGFLWAAYRDEAYYFELWVLAFKFSLGFAIPLVALSAVDQLLLFVIVLFGFTYQTLNLNAFSRTEDNFMEMLILSTTFFTAAAGMVFLDSADDENASLRITTLSVIVIALYAVCFAVISINFLKSLALLPVWGRVMRRVVRITGQEERVNTILARIDELLGVIGRFARWFRNSNRDPGQGDTDRSSEAPSDAGAD